MVVAGRYGSDSSLTMVKRRDAMIAVAVQFVVASGGFAVGIKAYTSVSNLDAGAFWSHVLVAVSALTAATGLSKKVDGLCWVIFGMIFNIIGGVTCFLAIIVDAIQLTHLQSTKFDECSYTVEGGLDMCYALVPKTHSDHGCSIELNPQTCYCCYIHYHDSHCSFQKNSQLSSKPSTYEGVTSCDFVEKTYQSMLWATLGLNILDILLVAISIALVQSYRKYIDHRETSCSCCDAQDADIPSSRGNALAPHRRPSTMESDSSCAVPNEGPLIIYTQQQTLEIFASNNQNNDAPAHIIQPPDYATAVSMSVPVHVQPGRQEDQLQGSGVHWDSQPPPYTP